jgi:predicted dehydrogenase
MQLEDLAGLELRPASLLRPFPSSLRIGLIGFGRIVNNNVMRAYRAGGLSVVAAADTDPAARDRASRQWGIPTVYADFREMLERERLDVVGINLRWDRGQSSARVDAVAAAAERGIHVMIAKPLAETYEQCEEIVRLAEAGGIKLAVDQNTRFAPSFHGVRSLIKAGAIGELLSATITWNAARGIQHRPDFDAVHDVTIHQVDALLSWFDREPVRVFGHQTRKTPYGSVFAATMVFDGGANATIRDDFATEHRRSWELAAVGDEGSIDGVEDIDVPEVGQPRMLRGTLRVGLHRLPGVSVELPLSYRHAPESFLASMGDLLQAIESDREPWASGKNVLGTMRTLLALERSAREEREIVLAPTASPTLTADKARLGGRGLTAP